MCKYFFLDRFENVCLVSKPCIETSINGPSLWRRYLKFSVKLAIRDDLKKEADEKMSAKTGGRQRTNRAKLEQANQIRQGTTKLMIIFQFPKFLFEGLKNKSLARSSYLIEYIHAV